MLLDVALDLVLDQPGCDGVEHRAEHDVFHALTLCGIDDAEPHLPLARVQGRPDVIDGPHTADSTAEHGGLAEVTDDHVVRAELTKHVGRCLGSHAGAHALACREQLGHQ